MDSLVINRFNPSSKQPVQLDQIHWRVRDDLDQELITDSPKEPFNFSSTLRLARTGMNEPDAKDRARPEKRR